jgi:hypothetical protein
MAGRNIFRNYENDPGETWYRKTGRAIGKAGRAVGNTLAPYKKEIALGVFTVAMGSCMIGGMIYVVSDYSNNKEYHFNGNIDGETVVFSESRDGKTNYLNVTKANGTQMQFTDKNDDLKLEEMSIKICEVTREAKGESPEIKQCNEAVYTLDANNTQAIQIVKDNQAVFDSYLEKILAQYFKPAGLDK